MCGLNLFFGLFYVAGFGLLGYGLWSVRRTAQAKSWPTAPAVLTLLEVREHVDNDSNRWSEVLVRYTYTVDSVAYQGSRVAFGYTGSGSRTKTDAVFRRLGGAAAVSARYNPADPAVSCLFAELDGSVPVVLAFGAGWLLFVSGFHAVTVAILAKADAVAK